MIASHRANKEGQYMSRGVQNVDICYLKDFSKQQYLSTRQLTNFTKQ